MGRRVSKVKPGKVIFIPPNKFHKVWNKGEVELEFLCFWMIKGDEERPTTQ